MDINTLHGISTIFAMLAFIGVAWWAFAPSRKKRFEEDALLPFADEQFDNQATEKKLHPKTDEERQD